VHGGHAQPGELVDNGRLRARHAGDDDVAHQASLSVTWGNTRM
jgi:hypothetical protein